MSAGLNYFSPTHATGLLYGETDGVRRFAGTCFLYGNDRYALTAGHVAEQSELSVLFPLMPRQTTIDSIIVHPSMDLAIIRLSDTYNDVEGVPTSRKVGADPRFAFWPGVYGSVGMGLEVSAYGYPGEAVPAETHQRQPRLFMGHIQSFYAPNTRGPNYMEYELSFPVPQGLSGGPVMRDLSDALGVAVGNLESEVVVERTERVDFGGQVERTVVVRHVSYGLFICLDQATEWLKEQIPA